MVKDTEQMSNLTMALDGENNMNEIRVMLKSGKKALVAAHNKDGLGITVTYDPAGGQLPRMLMGRFTTLEKAHQAIKDYLSNFKE